MAAIQAWQSFNRENTQHLVTTVGYRLQSSSAIVMHFNHHTVLSTSHYYYTIINTVTCQTMKLRVCAKI